MKKGLLTIFIIVTCVFLSECKKDPKPDVFRVTEVDVDASYKTAEINGSYTFSVIPDDMKIVYGEKDDLTDAISSKVNVGESAFHVNINNLSTETKYYYCFECYSSHSSARSEVHSFVTLKAEKPVVETGAVENITLTFATCGGNVVSDCGADVTERGVCWSTSQNPTINDNKTSDGAGIGTYNSSITGLNKNTTYYVRAYASNSVGTAYGDEKSFTTADEVLVPVIATISVDGITQTEAECKAEVITDGGASVTERGVCWSTSPNPTINDNITTNGNGTGTFTSNLINLTANTTYYVRAYANNSAGTGYGNEISFTTLKDIVKPTVKTNEVSSVVQDAAICGGVVIDDGGAEVTARGVCWSTSQNPTINGSHTDDGTGEGDFTSTITGLTAGTTYYVRAYATNEKGTSYGEEKSFMTSIYMDLPILTTKEIEDITETSATSGGEVVSDGGAPVIARGICWSTSQNPTIDDNDGMTTDGNGTGTFTSDLVNLTANTTYYVRAYATNVMGTAYGEQRSFTTEEEEAELTPPTVITSEVIDITETTAVSGGNVTDDGGATVTARGICWSMTQNPTLDDNDGFTSDGTGTGTFVSLMECLESNTTYYVRAYATNSEGTGYGDEKSFNTEQGQLPSGTINGHDYIDLGLPSGLLWATCNIGASFPREYGNYYAWGETTTKTEYTMDNSLTYGEDVGNNISGNVQYDAATANWGDGWRMPTEEEMEELIDECDWELIEICEQKVFKVTGPSNSYILLPLAGQAQYYEGEHDPLPEEGGRYWTASCIGTTDAMDLAIDANSSYQRTGPYYRYGGRSVRPVSGGNQTEPEATLPTITTSEVSNITENSAECGGNVTSDGGTTVTARGVCWSTSHNPTINDNKTTDGNGTGSFTSNIPNLAPNTRYYVRAYATNSTGTGYGDEMSFTTEEEEEEGCEPDGEIAGHYYVDLGLPSGLKWATCNVGASSPEEYGNYYAWGETTTKSEYTEENSATYGLTISQLQSQGYIDSEGNLTAQHDAATANWGGDWRMPTKEQMEELVEHCKWEWTQVNGVNGAKVIGPNGSCIFLPAAGYRYGSSLYNGGVDGDYWSSSPYDIYYGNNAYRLYFYNGYEDVYWGYYRNYGLTVRPISGGNQTEPEATLPTITTSEVSNITENSAECGGNVTSDGGAPVIARGICWSMTQNPTLDDNDGMTTDGNGTGTFTSDLVNLTANTTYYVRAYATNVMGTAYGEQRSFTTEEEEAELTPPTVITSEVIDITETTAVSGGNVTSDGGTTVTARGVCWSTSHNPTINDNKTTDGNGTGSFTSNIPNLAPNTRYYVRAYATNSTGTGYGDEMSFTTEEEEEEGCEPDGEIAGHYYVDLGLPSGLKWATCNVGASSPEEYGNYYAWGETSPKAEYWENNYQHWVDADGDGYWDYGESTINSDISGNAQYDAATANWGGSWRMPTQDEMFELVDYCEWEWTQVNGVDGSKVIGPNGNCIFLPAAGNRRGSSLNLEGYGGYYWSSTPYDIDFDYSAYDLGFYNGSEGVYWDYRRNNGLTVRPITE